MSLPSVYSIGALLVISGFLFNTPEAFAQSQGAPIDSTNTLVELIATDRFTVYERSSRSSVPVQDLNRMLDDIYSYVSSRTGATLDVHIPIYFDSKHHNECGPRAISQFAPEGSHVVVMLGDRADKEQLAGVLAHELGHIATFQLLGVPAADTGLSEGFASWAAGQYWSAWHRIGSFDVGVRRSIVQFDISLDGLASFYQATGEGCIQDRDLYYTAWASFVKFLIDRFGVERFIELMRSNLDRFPPSGPEYELTFGMKFPDLEAEWVHELTIDTQ